MFSYLWSDNSHIEELPLFKSSYVVSDILPVIWLEHCVECAMPLCYHTCDMYIDRGDGRCRRFVNGTALYKNDCYPTLGATMEFRRWAKLEGVVRTRKTVAISIIKKKERDFNRLAGIIDVPCKMLAWKWHRPSRLVENFFDEWYIPRKMKASSEKTDITGLLITVYNHDEKSKTIHCELKIQETKQTIFHKSLLLEHGWNEYLLDCSIPDDDKEYLSQIYIDNDETAKLTFQTLDFVVATQKISKKPAKKVKCVAWDLDNTMWKGVIGDDGKDGVMPNNDSVSLVKKLDEMGIIQTIVSKNEYEIAWDKLKDMGIAEYFLYPAINWGRKSQSLVNIAKELNINIDTFAVIDDSEFERNEISATLPQVRVYDVLEIKDIQNRPEFDIPITEESKQRRQSYIVESKRKTILASWSGDYSEFLKECEIKLELFSPRKAEEQKRCYELIQRSNQYNVTKDRRNESYIPSIIDNPRYKVYAFRVSDKFGNYGIVGFSSFEIVEGNYYLRDFVMSCRVAQKSIEQAFFNYILNQLDDKQAIIINIEKSDRNMPVRRELSKLSVTVLRDDESVLSLKLDKLGEDKTKNCVIEIINHG